jgi:hypothetical protein
MHRHEMQQIIIYLNIYPYRILFFSKIRALQLVNQGAKCHAILERRDDIDVGDTRKLVEFL